jgi:ferritin-like metal-binding protein YciE
MMATERTLNDLFLDTLKDIYFAEKQIVKALPKMARAAQSEEGKAGFLKHRDELLGKPAGAGSVKQSRALSPKAKRSWRNTKARPPSTQA